ncbi:MAG: hypothetical protein ACRDLP_02090 [Solirubrobacteraceae bacterium]
MRTRYATNAVFMILGAFLVVCSQAFAVSTFMWLMFASGIAALAIAGPAGALSSRGVAQRGLDGVTSVLGAWTIIAAIVFTGATVTWLGFASGAALFALALAGLTLHELKTERVVHSIEISSAQTAEFAGLR